MKQIYYTKKATSMWTFFHFNRFEDEADLIFLPAELKDEWQEMPVQFADELDNETIFSRLNSDEENPLSSEENQDWIRKSSVAHTSMSIGDCVIDSDGKWHVVVSEGFKKIEWIHHRHGHLHCTRGDSSE